LVGLAPAICTNVLRADTGGSLDPRPVTVKYDMANDDNLKEQMIWVFSPSGFQLLVEVEISGHQIGQPGMILVGVVYERDRRDAASDGDLVSGGRRDYATSTASILELLFASESVCPWPTVPGAT
jgi:hypothetical protein